MAAEIVAAVQICASAYRFMKTAVNEGRELGDMTRAMSKFWDAREEVSVLEQKATNPSKIEKLFGGKSVESQALEITLQKKKAEQLEKELKDLFYWTGNANLWHDMIRERAKIRNLRIAAARQKAQNRAAMIDIAVIGGVLGLLMVTVLAITSVAVE
jgi:molecular chaperone GrpE (heat shock protein)